MRKTQAFFHIPAFKMWGYFFSERKEKKMKFVLFEKLAELEGVELIMLLAAVAVFVILLAALVRYGKQRDAAAPKDATRAMVFGALCVALSFMLSYVKLFSMPMGGSLTLCSMLPICAYAAEYGPRRGFAAALAYSLLQIIQGAWIVHWAQFLLDYIVAFSCYGLAAFFPRRLPLGVGVAGLCRMLASVASGAIFFAESAAEAGWTSAWLYSLAYSGSTIGAEAVLCVIVALLPPVKRAVAQMKRA